MKNTMMEAGGTPYLDDAYDEQLDSLASNHPNVARAEAERLFLEECAQFRTFMDDWTPLEVIKRVAFQKTRFRLEDT